MKVRHILDVLHYSLAVNRTDLQDIMHHIKNNLLPEEYYERFNPSLDLDIEPKNFFEIAYLLLRVFPMSVAPTRDIDWRSDEVQTLVTQLGGFESAKILNWMYNHKYTKNAKFDKTKEIALYLHKVNLLTPKNWGSLSGKSYVDSEYLLPLTKWLDENDFLNQQNFDAIRNKQLVKMADHIVGIMNFLKKKDPALSTQENFNKVLQLAGEAKDIKNVSLTFNSTYINDKVINQSVLDIILSRPASITRDLQSIMILIKMGVFENYKSLFSTLTDSQLEHCCMALEFVQSRQISLPETMPETLGDKDFLHQQWKGLLKILHEKNFLTQEVFNASLQKEFSQILFLLNDENLLTEKAINFFLARPLAEHTPWRVMLAMLYEKAFFTQDTFDYLSSNPSIPLKKDFIEVLRILNDSQLLTGDIFKFLLDKSNWIKNTYITINFMNRFKLLTENNLEQVKINYKDQDVIKYLLSSSALTFDSVTQTHWDLAIFCIPVIKNNPDAILLLKQIGEKRVEILERDDQRQREGLPRSLDQAAKRKLNKAFYDILAGLAEVITQAEADNDLAKTQVKRYLREAIQTLHQKELGIRLTTDVQNTHTGSVHTDVSESLSKQALAFADFVDTQEKRDVIEIDLWNWIVPLQHSDDPNVRAAYRGFMRLMRDPIGPEYPGVLWRDFRDPTSQVSIAEAIYYFWLTIHYPAVRSDMTHEEWEARRKEYLTLLLDALCESQRGRTMDSDAQDFGGAEDYHICAGGTLNKIIEKLKAISSLVTLRVMRPEIASWKLPKVTLDALVSYLESQYSWSTPPEAAALLNIITVLENEGITDAGVILGFDFWEAIKPSVSEKMLEEFGEMYGNDPTSEQFIRLVEAGPYASVSCERLSSLKMLVSTVAENSPLALPLHVLYRNNKELLDQNHYTALSEKTAYLSAITMVFAALDKSGILSKETVSRVIRNAQKLESHGVILFLSNPLAVLSEQRFERLMQHCETSEDIAPLTPASASSPAAYSPSSYSQRLRRRYTATDPGSPITSPSSSVGDQRSPEDDAPRTPKRQRLD